jgi:hypothetical protein
MDEGKDMDEDVNDDDDDEAEDKSRFAEWSQSLRQGDRICILPKAKYGGWLCITHHAKIDVYWSYYAL